MDPVTPAELRAQLDTATLGDVVTYRGQLPLPTLLVPAGVTIDVTSALAR